MKVSSSATAVKISRTTSDGIYTLTQTITQNAGNALAQVSMSIKNNTTGSHHVGLLRWADIDAQGSTTNSFDYTYHTATGTTRAATACSWVLSPVRPSTAHTPRTSRVAPIPVRFSTSCLVPWQESMAQSSRSGISTLLPRVRRPR